MIAELHGADTKDTLCAQVVCHAVGKTYVLRITECIKCSDSSGYVRSAGSFEMPRGLQIFEEKSFLGRQRFVFRERRSIKYAIIKFFSAEMLVDYCSAQNTVARQKGCYEGITQTGRGHRVAPGQN